MRSYDLEVIADQCVEVLGKYDLASKVTNCVRSHAKEGFCSVVYGDSITDEDSIAFSPKISDREVDHKITLEWALIFVRNQKTYGPLDLKEYLFFSFVAVMRSMQCMGCANLHDGRPPRPPNFACYPEWVELALRCGMDELQIVEKREEAKGLLCYQVFYHKG